MYLDGRGNFDFSPTMPTGRVEVDINIKASVLEVGNTIVETYCVNGRPWPAFVKTFDDIRPLLLHWMQSPIARAYVAELLRYGIQMTPQWVNLYSTKLLIKGADGQVSTPADGSKLYAKTPAGIACGYGEVELGGKVIFMPIYAEDGFTPGIQGCTPGEEIHLYIATEGSPGEQRLYTNTPIIWTSFGARIEIPLLQVTPFVKVEKFVIGEGKTI